MFARWFGLSVLAYYARSVVANGIRMNKEMPWTEEAGWVMFRPHDAPSVAVIRNREPNVWNDKRQSPPVVVDPPRLAVARGRRCPCKCAVSSCFAGLTRSAGPSSD